MSKFSKKSKIIAVIIGILVIVNIPVKRELKDGGTVIYKSLLWEYDKVHRMNSDGGFDVGKTFEILGFEVYNNVAPVEKPKVHTSDKNSYKEAELPIHSITDELLAACEEQSIWMKNADYDWEKNPTIQSSKSHGTCVTYVACVLQRIGVLESGESLWHTGKGYGTGKVTGANDRMTVTYMDNKKLSSLKDQLKPGDIILVDDNKSGQSGSGGHIFILTGDWNGKSPYIWDNFTARNGQKPNVYSGSRKVLAVVRLKDFSNSLQNTTWQEPDGTTYNFKEDGKLSVSVSGTEVTGGNYYLYANDNAKEYKALFEASSDTLKTKFSDEISDKEGVPIGLCLILDVSGASFGKDEDTLFEYYGWYEGDRLILAEIATDNVSVLAKQE